jgi:hypothetical protein
MLASLEAASKKSLKAFAFPEKSTRSARQRISTYHHFGLFDLYE